jgi:hypothetical protein
MQFNQAISITMPYSLVVFMVRDFLQAASKGGHIDEKLIGSRSGILAGAMSLASVSFHHIALAFFLTMLSQTLIRCCMTQLIYFQLMLMAQSKRLASWSLHCLYVAHGWDAVIFWLSVCSSCIAAV